MFILLIHCTSKAPFWKPSVVIGWPHNKVPIIKTIGFKVSGLYVRVERAYRHPLPRSRSSSAQHTAQPTAGNGGYQNQKLEYFTCCLFVLLGFELIEAVILSGWTVIRTSNSPTTGKRIRFDILFEQCGIERRQFHAHRFSRWHF